MRHCRYCGRPLRKNEFHCSNCGTESLFGFTFEQVAFLICSVISIISLFQSWLSIDLWDVELTDITPVALIGAASDVVSALGIHIAGGLNDALFAYFFFIIILCALHGVTVYLLFLKNKWACLVGLVANYLTFFFSAGVCYGINELVSKYSFLKSVVSLDIGVYLALSASIIGIALFVRLFPRRNNSLNETLYVLGGTGLAVFLLLYIRMKSLHLF